jgi:hypothetical protein
MQIQGDAINWTPQRIPNRDYNFAIRFEPASLLIECLCANVNNGFEPACSVERPCLGG